MDRRTTVAKGDLSWIAPSKIEPSLPKINLVSRGRLLERLNAALHVKLALVVAPAGFGKSTLLGQWSRTLREQRVPCAWLSLDGNDSDPNQFLAYVAVALSHAGIDIGELEVGARNGFSNSATHLVRNRLVKLLSTMATPCVLVLDDYHLVDSTAIDRILKELLRDAPSSFSLVINSRKTTLLDSATLVASGEAIEIGAELLRLTRPETFSALGPRISATDAEEIYRQTEGWPVAVQLARVQKQTQADIPLRNASSRGLIANYLTDQVLSSLHEESRGFLLDVAALDRFNPDLANAVREREDSGRLLVGLDSLSALLVPLDYEEDWYRLHHLFGDCLREVLRRNDPHRLRRILQAASAWHAGRGRTTEAVKYAARAEDWAECERLVLQAGGWKIILREGIGVLRSIFRCIPAEVVANSPRLLIARAYLHCKDGEQGEARTLLDAASALGTAGDRSAERDKVAVGAILNAYEDSETWVRAADLSTEQVPREDLDPFEAGALASEEVLFHFARGNFPRAERSLKSAFTHLRRSGSVLALNYCYLHAGVAAIHRGDLDVAAANIARALEMAKSNFGADSGLKHLALVLDYALRVWRGDATAANFEDFSATLSHVEAHDGWTNIYMLGLDAAFHLAEQCGLYEATGSLATRYQELARRRNLDRLETFARVLAARAAAHAGHEAEAALQFGLIGEWLSRNSPLEQPWVWQTYFLGVAYEGAGPGPITERIEQRLLGAIEYARTMSADSHRVRLLVSLAAYHRRAGSPHDAKCALLDAVRVAYPQTMLGPFLCDPATVDAVRQLRRDLRTDEGELLSTAFMTKALSHASMLRPNAVQSLLSDREQEVLDQLAHGKTNKEIAGQLELTENTVKFHLKNLFSKLGVHRRTEATAEARRLGLLE